MELVSLERLALLKEPEPVTKFPLDNQMLLEMNELLDKSGGVGLAATQVGLNLRFFLLKPAKQTFVVCNPEASNLSTRMALCKEGCLSLPNQRFVVPRYWSIRLDGQNENGEKLCWNLKGLMAQICQHELQHLFGLTIKDISERIK